MTTPYKTSLNEDPTNYRDACNRWARGQDWFIVKAGKRGWMLAPCFGNFPIFKTKKAAYEAGTNLVLAASRIYPLWTCKRESLTLLDRRRPMSRSQNIKRAALAKHTRESRDWTAVGLARPYRADVGAGSDGH